MAGSQQYTVGTSATPIGSAPAEQSVVPGPTGWLLVLADATTDAYLGGPGVTSTNGMKITHAVTTPIAVPLFPGDQVFAVVATGSATISVLQTGA